MSTATYDVVIVGAGSAGATLAARLSESGERSVLLLEAGPAWRRVEEIPGDLMLPGLTTATIPGHPNNWALPSEEMPGISMPIPRGKGIGGSSLINGTYFIRAPRRDFDVWSERGNDLWSYDKVLPAFRRLEHDLDFGGEAHGADGPIFVTREPGDRAPEFTAAFTEACLDLGFPSEPDKNATGAGGVGPVPLNIKDGQRISTALGYLLPNVGRPNLTVIGDAHVTRVLLSGTTAIGVEAVVAGQRRRFDGAEIVVSAGALRSPQLLMLSGIGPESHLRAHGIEVRAALPGVGQGLVDHPEIAIPYEIDAPRRKSAERGVFTSALHWASEDPDTPGDLEILPFVTRLGDGMRPGDMLKRPRATFAGMRGTPWKVTSRQMRLGRFRVLLLSLQQQDSRGSVSLRSGDPLATPAIAKNLLTHPLDMQRFREATRTAVRIFESAPMKRAGGKLVDMPDSLTDDAALDAFVTASFFTAGHPSSTCRMGSDDTAVVDQYGRVHGVENLRVVDGSIFPTIPSRGPNATTIMAGERIAELMLHAGQRAAGGTSEATGPHAEELARASQFS